LDHNSLLGAPAVKASRKGFELDSDGRMVAVGDDESRDEAMSKFLKAFPSVDLVVAWSALCDLRIHSLDDPVLISDSVAAFHWHASFMIKYSKSYEWAGLLRYHFSVAATRSKHGFLPQSWYRQVDQITFNAIGDPSQPGPNLLLRRATPRLSHCERQRHSSRPVTPSSFA